MYELSEEIKNRLSKSIGIPYEKLITMDDDEISAYIEQKNGKKMEYSKPDMRFSGSGDDSVLIDSGRLITKESIDKKINKVLKYYKSKKQQKQALNIEDELEK